MVKDSTRETFDFKQYPDVSDFLKKKQNKTKYLVDLIRADMNENPVQTDKEQIFAIIEEYLQTKNIIMLEKPVEEKNDNDDKLKASVLKVMNYNIK